jgi:flavin reductase (DIM6/NTAB) family NADH-FMN oxidoreductase RutF
MEIAAAYLEPENLYNLITGTVVPRPITWISTLSKAGFGNLAPFSYFNAASEGPPTIMFSASLRDGLNKDTVQDIIDTGEFVFNMVTADLVEAMNATAVDSPLDRK